MTRIIRKDHRESIKILKNLDFDLLQKIDRVSLSFLFPCHHAKRTYYNCRNFRRRIPFAPTDLRLGLMFDVYANAKNNAKLIGTVMFDFSDFRPLKVNQYRTVLWVTCDVAYNEEFTPENTKKWEHKFWIIDSHICSNDHRLADIFNTIISLSKATTSSENNETTKETNR